MQEFCSQGADVLILLEYLSIFIVAFLQDSLSQKTFPDRSTYTAQKATTYWVTTVLATSKNVLFPAHNHLLTTSTDDPSFAGARVIIIVLGHQYWWLTVGYDLEIGPF